MAEYLQAAKEEFLEAALAYEDEKAGLGSHFQEMVLAKEILIGEHPGIGRPVQAFPDSLRRLAVAGFPYSVIYRTEPALLIVAIAHHRRRPNYWAKRL